MSGALQEAFTVMDSEGGQYTFKIPTITFDMVVGYKAAEIRRRAFPEAGGTLGALDFQAVQFSRCCAFLELYLTASTKLWPYGFKDSDIDKLDPRAPPVVDFEKFPVSCSDLVFEVGGAFETEYARFRRPRDTDKRPTGA
jgi:hypothetical protein